MISCHPIHGMWLLDLVTVILGVEWEEKFERKLFNLGGSVVVNEVYGTLVEGTKHTGGQSGCNFD